MEQNCATWKDGQTDRQIGKQKNTMKLTAAFRKFANVSKITDYCQSSYATQTSKEQKFLDSSTNGLSRTQTTTDGREKNVSGAISVDC